MSKFNKMEEEFIARGAVVMQPNNQWFMMNKVNSLEFVKECKSNLVQILGIDGFYLLKEGIQPNMDNSIDFTVSSYKGSGDIYKDAIDFLKDRDDDLYFEIVCN